MLAEGCGSTALFVLGRGPRRVRWPFWEPATKIASPLHNWLSDKKCHFNNSIPNAADPKKMNNFKGNHATNKVYIPIFSYETGNLITRYETVKAISRLENCSVRFAGGRDGRRRVGRVASRCVASRRVASRRVALVQAAAAQVVGDDDVGDGVEHELDVVGVGGAGHVAVDLLGG